MADATPSIEERMSAHFAAEEAPPPPDVVEDVEQGAASAALSDREEETEETTDEVTEETEDSAEPDESEELTGDEVSIEDISQLADHLGIDVSEMYNLRVPITDSEGKRRDITLGEWKDGFQLNEQAQKVQKQAQEEYDALTKQRQEFEQQAQAAAAQTQRYIQAAQKELTQEFNAINWESLRQQDPGQYAVKRQDFIERNARLGQLEQQAAQEWQQQQTQLQQQREAQYGKYLEREQQALYESIPEWRNEEAARTEKSRVSEYLQSTGYTPEEIGNAADHRAIVLARKAMLWDESQKKADTAKKKVLKIGKRVLKPSTRQSKATQTMSRERELKAAVRKGGGKMDDVAALIQARLGR